MPRTLVKRPTHSVALALGLVALALALGLAVLVISVSSPGASSVTRVGSTLKKPPRGMRVSGRWYRATSAFNTPIPAHAAVAAKDATLIRAFSTTFAHGGLGFSLDWMPTVWIVNDSTPARRVRITTTNSTYCCVPIPSKAFPDSSAEGHMLIAHKNSGAEWDFYKAIKKPDGEWQAALVKKTSWMGSGSARGDVRASQTSEGAGLTRPRDTRRPAGSTWDHALAFTYAGTLAGKYVRPARATDGTCTDTNKCVPMGSRFQLDPKLNCNTWRSLRYEWRRQVCRTLQKYGMIVVASTEGGPTLFEQHRKSVGSYKYPWEDKPGDWGLMPADLLAHFRVLAHPLRSAPKNASVSVQAQGP
jgi:hypothetical protein